MPFLNIEQPIQTTGNNLVGLWRPSFVKVNKKLFVYGGGGNVTNNLNVLNLNNLSWETIQNVKGVPPSKRYGHTATLWNDCIVIFGGCNEYQEYCNDIYLFDIKKNTWYQPEINGLVPARYLHSAVVYDNKLFIYGGFAKNSECTYVLDELSVLDLNLMRWSRYHGIPPRYNHSATLVGTKMYIFAGKDEQGNTVSDLFVINLSKLPYTPHLVLAGTNQMVLLKSQHFCESICGKLLVFGRYLNNLESNYGFWILDLDTLVWEKQDCQSNFDVGGWNYFTVINESSSDQINFNNLFFLGNTDPYRPQGYDHFRDALVINCESLGLFDIKPLCINFEFSNLLNNQELSDFIIMTEDDREIYVHQLILMTRWPHFKNLYRSGMMESREKRMKIPESHQVVIEFLKYLYNDQLDETIPFDIICQLLMLGNIYLLNRLKKLCCQRLYKHHLSMDTCLIIFEKAILTDEIGLKLLTLDFMFKNLGYLLKSNLLLNMSTFLRSEFLNSIPNNAILKVNHRQQSYHPTSSYNHSQLTKLNYKSHI